MDRFKPLAAALRPIGASIIERRADHVGADISQIEQLGVPGFAPMLDTRDYFHYHHTPADTLDKVNPEDLKRHVATLAVLSWWLADAPEALPRNPPSPQKDRWKLNCPAGKPG